MAESPGVEVIDGGKPLLDDGVLMRGIRELASGEDLKLGSAGRRFKSALEDPKEQDKVLKYLLWRLRSKSLTGEISGWEDAMRGYLALFPDAASAEGSIAHHMKENPRVYTSRSIEKILGERVRA